MSKWIRTSEGMASTMVGRNYLIKKEGDDCDLYCDGLIIGGPYIKLKFAADAAEAHAALSPPTKPGIHIDDIAGQQLIDILKRSFTTARIQDFIDASPFDEPDTGAPEGGPLG